MNSERLSKLQVHTASDRVHMLTLVLFNSKAYILNYSQISHPLSSEIHIEATLNSENL